MKYIDDALKKLNRGQQKFTLLAFIIAVIKKYNDDRTGTQAALLTYYSFLSVFPLLLVLTTLTDTVVGHDVGLRTTVIKGLTNYFPLLGNQLSTHVHRLHADGFALASGLLITIYGTRGVANSFIGGVQNIWLIPRKDRPGFPKSLYKSLGVIIVGGIGLIVASIIASLASSAGHGFIFKAISLLINLIILTGIFIFLLNFSLPKHVKVRDVKSGALTAAIGLLILQSVGGYVLAHELKHLSALYSYFAVALGLVFWLYLQSQVLYYSIEVAVVNSNKYWPRSLDNRNLNDVDIKLQELTAQVR
jgi:YihY family inner membrane protein